MIKQMAEIGPWVNKVIDAPEGKLDQYYKEDICDFWDSTKIYVDLDANNVATIPVTDVTTEKPFLEETTSGSSNHIASLEFLITMCVHIVFILRLKVQF